MNTAIVVLTSIVVLVLFGSVIVALASEIQGRPRRTVDGGDAAIGATAIPGSDGGLGHASCDCGGSAGIDVGGHC